MIRADAVGRRRVAPPQSRDSGMVLIETALVIPVLAAVALALVWALSLAVTSASLGDAARNAARSLARGEAAAEVVGRAESAVPGAVAEVRTEGESVVVLLRRDVSPPVPILDGLSLTVSQRVVVPREWQ